MAFDLFQHDAAHFVFIAGNGHGITQALQKFDLMCSYR
jgi:hypothetical protein